MRSITFSAMALLCATSALAGCSGSSAQTGASVPAKAGRHIVIVDVSVSPATMNDPAVTSAAERRIGENMTRNAKLGDVFTVFESGNADASRMVGYPPIVSGYTLRLPAAHAKLTQQLHDVARDFHAHGGDNATHLVQSLETIHPDCSSGRDTITFETDGLEEDGAVSSARALAAGKPVHLPSPPGRYLAGCHKVTFLGFGLTDTGAGKEQLLPARQLAALRQGWLDYLTAAGMRAQDVEFVSAL